MNGRISNWSFYDPSTGLFSGHRYTGHEALLALNTPAGLAAVEGIHDCESRRLDTAQVEAARAAHSAAHRQTVEAQRAAFVPDVVKEGERPHPGQKFEFTEPPEPLFTPTAAPVVDYQPPAPSADHEWNPATRRWQVKAAVLAAQEARAAALAQITALEHQQARPLREAALGLPGAVDRLRAIDASIAALRAGLAP